MIARGRALPETLDALCRLVEEVARGVVSSILLLDREGLHVQHAAAPSLPKVYVDAIDGSPIGRVARSCGTAAYRKEPVTVIDIANDPLWAAYKELALPHDLRACWSTPVFASDGRTLGTVAIYTRETRGPTPAERGVIEQITHLASIAIERTLAEEQREAHLSFLECMDRVNRAIQGTNDLDQMMREVLDTALSLFDSDHAWLVYPCDPDAPSHGVKMERTRPEFPAPYRVGADMPMEPGTAHVFRIARASNGPVRFGPGSQHPMPDELSRRLGDLSRIVMALYPKVDQPYLFGISQCSHARAWTAQEARLVEGIGRRIEDALTVC